MAKKKSDAAPKAAPKKKKAAPKKPSLASLSKQMHDKGLSVPDDATVSMLEHRLAHWRGPNGYVVRLYRNAVGPLREAGLMSGKMYWLPDSDWAQMLIETKRLQIVTRTQEPPGRSIPLDVPEGWNGSN